MFHKIYVLCSLLAVSILMACSPEEDYPGRGTLRIALDGVSASVSTRHTPSELGKPDASDFDISVTNANGKEVYHHKYTSGDIHLLPGEYTITATFGDNPLLALDNPYYIGTAAATVDTENITEANVVCKVGNALVSASFGSTEEEQARFKRFYSSYSLDVILGSHSVSITNERPQSSVYFRAGSSVSLAFSGVLKANGQRVCVPLSTEGTSFPQILEAADHAKVTLTMDEPESACITKIEMEEATLDNVIPVSWLALPTATVQHSYDGQGCLTGTDLSFKADFQAPTWKAEVADASGNIYRTVEGEGSLTSLHQDNAGEWPYLPTGEYAVTYYICLDGTWHRMGSRPLTVPTPDLRVTATAYTSYSLYIQGDADGANACDAYTIYSPMVTHNVAPALMDNPRYAPSLLVTLEGNAITGTTEGSTVSFPDQGGQTPSFDPYTLAATLSFAGNTASATFNDLYITGLPVTFAPPTGNDWTTSGKVEFESDQARLGQNATAGGQSITCSKFAVPQGSRVEIAYDVLANCDIARTTLTLSFGGQTYLSESPSRFKNQRYTNVVTLVAESAVTQAKADNSYGLAQCYSRVYSLSYKYGR